MRLLTLPLTILSLLLLLCLTDCGTPDQKGVYIIPLTDSLRTYSAGNYKMYYGVEDTVLWDSIVAAADTVVPPDGDQFKMRSGGIWYVAKWVDGGLRMPFQFPGWAMRVDSVNLTKSIVRLPDDQRAIVTIPAAQTVLGGDSLTIGLVRVLDHAFLWQTEELDHPDYLVLKPVGTKVIGIRMDSDDAGPITRQTVFRVGRRYYALTNVADDFSSLTVEAIPEARGMPLAAELETQYKRIPVKDMNDSLATVARTPGRELAVYFFSLGADFTDQVGRIDSLFHELPVEKKKELDIAFVCKYALPDSVRAFVSRNRINLPVYQMTEKTCRLVNCNNYNPFFVAVNKRGRVVSYGLPHQELEDKLREMQE